MPRKRFLELCTALHEICMSAVQTIEQPGQEGDSEEQIIASLVRMAHISYLHTATLCFNIIQQFFPAIHQLHNDGHSLLIFYTFMQLLHLLRWAHQVVEFQLTETQTGWLYVTLQCMGPVHVLQEAALGHIGGAAVLAYDMRNEPHEQIPEPFMEMAITLHDRCMLVRAIIYIEMQNV